MWVYLSNSEILVYKLGIDYSSIDSNTLTVFIKIATEMINDYLEKDYTLTGEIEEQTYWIVDKQNRIFFKVNNKPTSSLNSIKMKAIGWPEIDVDVTKVDFFKSYGYGYINFFSFINNSYFSYPRWLFWMQDNFSLTVKYTIPSNNTPEAVKMACAMLVTNMAKAWINSASTGVQWASWDITWFTSWNYSVEFKDKEMMYQWGIESKRWYLQSNYMTPEVLSLLNPYKSIGQNLI